MVARHLAPLVGLYKSVIVGTIVFAIGLYHYIFSPEIIFLEYYWQNKTAKYNAANIFSAKH